MSDRIRKAIQEVLDDSGDGWTVTQYVVAMGLEKITVDGEIEATAWYYAPQNQAGWQTCGLLDQAVAMYESNDSEYD